MAKLRKDEAAKKALESNFDSEDEDMELIKHSGNEMSVDESDETSEE